MGWLSYKHIHVIEWPSQILDLNQVENLKQAYDLLSRIA